MRVVLAFHQGDSTEALRWLKWAKRLGGCQDHHLLLVADSAAQWNTCMSMIEAGNSAFRSASLITTARSVSGWPKGANELFVTAAARATEDAMPFLWCEPDAIPLKAGWVKEIHDEYSKCGKEFMGRFYRCDNVGMPHKLVTGIAVYPADTLRQLGEFTEGDKPWDVAAANYLIERAHNTMLIQHFWGMPNMPPTFASQKTAASPINTFTLENIKPGTCIFHRNKDGTLIRILHKQLFPQQPVDRVESANDIVVVLPFCNKDAELMKAQLEWMIELGGCPNHKCILAYDKSTLRNLIADIIKRATQCFKECITFIYPVPPTTDFLYASKHAFRYVADYIEADIGQPWLWWEADMTAIRPGFIDTLQDEYQKAGKPFMGPIIHEMGHCNGTAIYPADCLSRCPSLLLNTPNDAFDTGMSAEMRGLTHDANHLMQHCWVVDGSGKCLRTGYGDLPWFKTKELVASQILPTAQTFHRVKDTSLIKWLRVLRKEHGNGHFHS